MALTNEEILDAIASKTVLEISELIKIGFIENSDFLYSNW